MAGKTVLLTGASQGIGRAAAEVFADAGYRLALVARHSDRLASLAESLAPAQTLAIPADITAPDAPQKIVARAVAHFGKVDILINNAGVGVYGKTHTASPADLAQVMAVNFFAPVQLMQAVIPHMLAHGGGLIINVSSIIGKRATPLAGGYCASKAALEHIVESMRVELAADHIRFSTLYPGVTRTDFAAHTLGERQHPGRVQGVSAERVARKLLQVAKKEPRDAYVTLFDRIFVTGSHLFPSLFDRLLARYFG